MRRLIRKDRNKINEPKEFFRHENELQTLKDSEIRKFRNDLIVCPKCSSEVSQTGTNRSADNRIVTRYYKCNECQFAFSVKEKAAVKITIHDRDHSIERICNQINHEFAKKNDGRILSENNLLESLNYEVEELNQYIEEALSGDDFYTLVREVFIQSLDRFEVLETIPHMIPVNVWDSIIEGYGLKELTREEVLSLNIHWPEANSPYILDPQVPPVIYLQEATERKRSKYLKTNKIKKQAFPKQRRLERKPLKKNKLG